MPRFQISTCLWTVAATLGVVGPAAAQAPTVGFAFPPGGQIGTKATVTLNGGGLQGATGVLLTGEGVQAQLGATTNAAALPVDLTIAPDAKPGLREVRVITPRGTSNAGRVWIGGYPQANEVEPNNALTAAQKLEKLPITLSGQVNGAEDVDDFTFQAAAGDTFVFDLVAFQMASGLDGYLALYDAKGKILQYAQEPFDRDPRLIHTFKTAGTYTIQVRDSMFRGGANFFYQLTVGKLPVVTSYLPRGGKHGEMVNVQLEGVNLGGMTTMPVQIPAAGQDRVSVVPNTPAGLSMSTLSLEATDLSEGVEAEPNDTLAQATTMASVPGAVSGKIDKRGDIDLYRIKPAAAGTLEFEVFARRLGSRMDSVLRVLDATGKELATNDDADGKDSRLTVTVAAGTEYLVEVRSIDQNYGGDSFYRLEVSAPSPQDYRLTVTPPDFNLSQGGSASATLTVTRVAGFGGPITARVEGLPAGVVASPITIPAGAASALFTLTSDGAAPGASGSLRVVGTATVNGAAVERVAQPVEIYAPPLAAQGQTAQRLVIGQGVGVGPVTSYVLNVDQRAVTVKRGATVPIKVTATRAAGQTAQIVITAAGQPGNVTPALQNIAANANEATINIAVAAGAAPGVYNIVFSGNLSNVVQTTPAITLTITE